MEKLSNRFTAAMRIDHAIAWVRQLHSKHIFLPPRQGRGKIKEMICPGYSLRKTPDIAVEKLAHHLELVGMGTLVTGGFFWDYERQAIANYVNDPVDENDMGSSKNMSAAEYAAIAHKVNWRSVNDTSRNNYHSQNTAKIEPLNPPGMENTLRDLVGHLYLMCYHHEKSDASRCAAKAAGNLPGLAAGHIAGNEEGYLDAEGVDREAVAGLLSLWGHTEAAAEILKETKPALETQAAPALSRKSRQPATL